MKRIMTADGFLPGLLAGILLVVAAFVLADLIWSYRINFFSPPFAGACIGDPLNIR